MQTEFKGRHGRLGRLNRPPALAQEARNTSTFQQGVWAPMRGATNTGLGKRTTNSSASIARFVSRHNTVVQATQFGGTLYSDAPSGSTLLSDLLNQGEPLSFAVLRRLLFVSDGVTPMRVWDGIGSAVDAGLSPPAAAPGAPSEPGAGVVTSGVHQVRYRYKSRARGTVSPPSLASEFTASGSANLRFTIAASGGDLDTTSDGDLIIVEMTTAGGTAFFTAGEFENAAGNADINLSDTQLAAQPAPNYDLGQRIYSDAPPRKKYLLAARDRLIAYGERVTGVTASISNGSASLTISESILDADTHNGASIQFDGDATAYVIEEVTSATAATLTTNYTGTTKSSEDASIFRNNNEFFYTEAGQPELWLANPLTTLDNEPVEAAVALGNGIVFYGLSSMATFVWTGDPLQGVRSELPGTRGCLSHRAAITVESVAYALDTHGIHAYDGSRQQHISVPVDDFLDENLDFSRRSQIFAVFLPRRRAIRWYFPGVGASFPNLYVELDLDHSVWTTGDLGALALVAATNGPNASGAIETFAVDNIGFTLSLDTADGWCSTKSTLTADTGATTTSVPVKETLTTNELAGAPIALGDSLSAVESNTTDTLTLAQALGAAPAEDDVLDVGLPAPSRLKLPAVALGHNLTSFEYFWLWFEPLAAGELRVRFYRNFSGTALTWTGAQELVEEPAVTPPADGESDWIVDLSKSDGLVRIPVGMEAIYALEAELEVRRGSQRVKVYAWDLRGQSREVHG